MMGPSLPEIDCLQPSSSSSSDEEGSGDGSLIDESSTVQEDLQDVEQGRRLSGVNVAGQEGDCEEDTTAIGALDAVTVASTNHAEASSVIAMLTEKPVMNATFAIMEPVETNLPEVTNDPPKYLSGAYTKGAYAREAIARKDEKKAEGGRVSMASGQTEAQERPSPALSSPGAIRMPGIHPSNSSRYIRNSAGSFSVPVSPILDAPVVEAQIVDHEAEAALAAEVERLRLRESTQKRASVVVEASDVYDDDVIWCRKRSFAIITGLLFCAIVVAIPLVVVFSNGRDNDPSNEGTHPSGDVSTNFSITDYSVYGSAVNATRLWDTFNEYADTQALGASPGGPFTIFVPSNKAWDQLSTQYFEDQFVAHLREILLHHMIPGMRPIESFLNDTEEEMVLMMNGEWQNVTRLVGSNEMISLSPSLNVSARVVQPNLMDEHGNLVHIIDSVLQPSFFVPISYEDFAKRENITKSYELTIFTGLGESLLSVAEFTILSPSNEALEAVPPDVEEQLRSDRDLFLRTLSASILPGVVPREHLARNQTLQTMFGYYSQQVTTWENGTIRVKVGDETATIIRTDLLARNVVVHIIDMFFIPNDILAQLN